MDVGAAPHQDRAPALGAAPTVLTAVWLGFAVGLVELALLALRRWGLGIPIYLTPQVVWAAPLSYAVLFVPVGLVLAVLGRRWQAVGAPATLVFSSLLFGTYSALQVFSIQLHGAAALVLALGVAWRAAASAARHHDRLDRLIRYTTLPLGLGVGALAGVVNLAPIIHERRVLARFDAARPDAPNVLLIILDTMRAASMSLYHHARPTTPNLERLAARGIVFERAIVTSPWSNPSHAGIFTGRFPHEVASGWERGLDDTLPTIAEAALAAGYRTGGFSANTRYVSRQAGMARGFARFDDFPVLAPDAALATTWAGRWFVTRGNLIPRALGIRDTPGRKYASDVLEPLLDWIAAGGERPFFAMVNLMDVHGPYLPPDPYARRFGAAPMPNIGERLRGRLRQLVGGAPLPLPVGREPSGYEAAIAYLDARLGEFFDEMEGRGVLRNTVVILTSDHGEEFPHEKGLFGHGISLHWPAIHVPLVIWLPGGQHGGLRVREPVSLRAIPATVADLLDLRFAPFPGPSLARAWSRVGTVGDTARSELPKPAPVRSRTLPKGPMVALVVDSLHYIRYGDGSEQLFDIVTDPWERENLVQRADSATLHRFRAMIGGGRRPLD